MAFDKQSEIAHPLARSERLLVQHVGDETVAFDEDTKTAHALHPLAAAVFMYADGKNSIAEIAELAAYRLDREVTESEVREAVGELHECALLQAPTGVLEQGISRRTALKAFAAAGAGTMLISSVAAPFASANTLTNNGNPFTCGQNGNPITNYGGYNIVGGSHAPGGWYQPYYKDRNGNWHFVTGTSNGAPVTAGNYQLGDLCHAASNVYGTYQVVPCDGGFGYQCAQVACVPTSDGTKTGAPLHITGAITSGSILPASDWNANLGPGNGYGPYYDAAYAYGWPFKFCCGNGQQNCTS